LIDYVSATQAVVTLRAQYRMSDDIMAIPNALVYNGALASGSLAVASRALHLPQLTTSVMPPWLQKVCWDEWDDQAHTPPRLSAACHLIHVQQSAFLGARWRTQSIAPFFWTLTPAHIWLRPRQQRRCDTRWDIPGLTC
jgi:AAA domain